MTAFQARGYLVHLYTTSTLLFVVLGVQWILEGRYQLALLAMAVTLVIDATDGALARKHRVAQAVPHIDGALLDNVVDFASYVFLPILFLIHAGFLLQPVWAFATLLAFASAYGFSRTGAKQSDEGFFVGFPSYWNVVAFYVFVLGLSPALTTALVVGLSLLTFTDLRFLYISRMRRGRLLHLVLSGAWGVAAMAALLLEAGPLRDALAYASLGYVAFYTAHSFVLDRQGRRDRSTEWRRPTDLTD
jgi:phosphatidylcholine synthase